MALYYLSMMMIGVEHNYLLVDKEPHVHHRQIAALFNKMQGSIGITSQPHQ